MNNRQQVVNALPAIFEEIAEVNAKWHINADGTPKLRDDDFIYRCVLLKFSELMEAFEGIRKGNQPDDHLPQYPTESVEMVDMFIRAIDNLVFSDEVSSEESLTILSSGLPLGMAATTIDGMSDIGIYTQMALTLAKAFDEISAVFAIIDLVIAYCDLKQIPMMEIYRAKTDYNKNRKDHKPEARAAIGGKQF